MDPKQRVEDLLIICGRLADVLEKENFALRNQRGDELRALLDDKSLLSRAYESRVSGLADRPQQLAEVDADLREQLREVGVRVNGLMAENDKLLRVGLESHRRMVEVIANAVKATQPGPGTYSRAGTVGQPARRNPMHSAPLTVNRSL